jgi:hypothetical protein
MCEKEEVKCEFRSDLKGCALKHIREARKLLSEGKVDDADAMLSYAETHLKEHVRG